MGEFIDPYLYPDTEVLRNNPGIRDPRAASRFERREGTGEPFKPLIEEVLKPPLDGLSLLDEELYRASNPDGG